MVKYSRMEESKRVFEEQYDTDEYEALTCECHHLARAKELNGSRRKPFFCIYCKSMYKDKNKLNLHRLEGCFAVTNGGRKTVLKIYPMFGKGQRGEIEDILIKHGHMNPRKKPSRAKRKKAAAAAAPVAVVTFKEPGTSLEQEEPTPLRPQKLKVRGMLSSSSETQKKHQHQQQQHQQQQQQQQQQQKQQHQQQQQQQQHQQQQLQQQQQQQRQQQQQQQQHLSLSDSEMQIPCGHNSRDSTLVVGRGEMQVQMQSTREQVEAQAWGVAQAWEASTLPDADATPPEVVPCPGLWRLMQFQLLPSDFPDVRDDAFLEAFFGFVDNGPVDPSLRSSYGTWYMERETDADEEERSAVKLTMARFKLVQGHPDLIARHKEKMGVQAFRQYQKDRAQYEARKEASRKELRSRQTSYVKEKLDAFDASVQARHKERRAVWNWSPLVHILQSDAMAGVPAKPWSHSDAEQEQLARAVLVNRRALVVTEPPPRCPLIVRLFKIVYLYCFEKNSTLSDPLSGLLRETMLGYSVSESAAPVLRISAQSVLNEGCFLFADLPPYSDAQAEVFRDINALLHGSVAEREAVVQKAQGFLKVVRQRAIGDMAQLYPAEFRVLWCGGEETLIAEALNRFMLCLKSREDLDMRWVPFPAGHPDCDAVAVTLAREAVLKAVHKLYDQRVLSDKTRLQAAASARVAAAAPATTATTEKFQALVETCAVHKSRAKLDSAANGFSGDGDDESKLFDQRSSYSTTSGSSAATTLPSSRSSATAPTTATTSAAAATGGERLPYLFTSSPDLNLSLDSSPDQDSPLTTHMAGLHAWGGYSLKI